jgi:hypothetical protein
MKTQHVNAREESQRQPVICFYGGRDSSAFTVGALQAIQAARLRMTPGKQMPLTHTINKVKRKDQTSK